MASRSANVLIIFIVAIFAFCLASVFASMTGPIAILPHNNDSDTLDNITIAFDDNSSNNNYNHQSYTKQTSNNKNTDDSKDNDKSDVETTVDKTTTKDKKTTDKDTSKKQDTDSPDSSPSSGDDVETTSDD